MAIRTCRRCSGRIDDKMLREEKQDILEETAQKDRKKMICREAGEHTNKHTTINTHIKQKILK